MNFILAVITPRGAGGARVYRASWLLGAWLAPTPGACRARAAGGARGSGRRWRAAGRARAQGLAGGCIAVGRADARSAGLRSARSRGRVDAELPPRRAPSLPYARSAGSGGRRGQARSRPAIGARCKKRPRWPPCRQRKTTAYRVCGPNNALLARARSPSRPARSRRPTLHAPPPPTDSCCYNSVITAGRRVRAPPRTALQRARRRSAPSSRPRAAPRSPAAANHTNHRRERRSSMEAKVRVPVVPEGHGDRRRPAAAARSPQRLPAPAHRA